MQRFSSPFVRSFAVMFLFIFLLGPYSVEAAVTYYDSASNPADNGTLGSATVSVTPPSGMQEGDLVILVSHARVTSDAMAIANDGGQTWTDQGAFGRSNLSTEIFWATYNGTWSADPSISFTTTTSSTVVMYVFRPDGTGYTWDIDATQLNTSSAAPSSPCDVIRTSITTNTNGALAFALWASPDDDSWTLQTGGWTNAGSAQHRNLNGSDSSQSAAYQVFASSGSTGDVTNRQTTNGCDANIRSIVAFKEVAPVVDLTPIRTMRLFGGFIIKLFDGVVHIFSS